MLAGTAVAQGRRELACAHRQQQAVAFERLIGQVFKLRQQDGPWAGDHGPLQPQQRLPQGLAGLGHGGMNAAGKGVSCIHHPAARPLGQGGLHRCLIA